MTGPITGRYPGGPQRTPPGSPPRVRPKLPRVEERQAQMNAVVGRRRRRRRQRKLLLGFLFSFLLAAASGWVLGVRSRDTAERLRAASSQARSDNPINDEVTRTLLELWKMEDVEYARGRGKRR